MNTNTDECFNGYMGEGTYYPIQRYPDWNDWDYQRYPCYPITINYPYPDKKKTGIVLEGNIEELIPLIEGVKGKVRITIENIEEDT